MKAILVEQPGGPEALKLCDAAKPSPGPGQALVKVAYSGVNFIDIYFRTGLYKADPPFGLGMEAAGVVVRDMRSNPQLSDALRISIGTPQENDVLLSVLQAGSLPA